MFAAGSHMSVFSRASTLAVEPTTLNRLSQLSLMRAWPALAALCTWVVVCAATGARPVSRGRASSAGVRARRRRRTAVSGLPDADAQPASLREDSGGAVNGRAQCWLRHYTRFSYACHWLWAPCKNGGILYVRYLYVKQCLGTMCWDGV